METKVGSGRRQRILVVEDDTRMLDLLCRGLREVGHTPMPATDGHIALELILKVDFDSIILDIGLPGKDGLVVANSLRATKRTPVLMLTARDSEEDILRGFQAGADDYLTKPFSFREMLARLDVLNRRSKRQESSFMRFDPARMIVYRELKAIQLTRNEYLLLAALHASPNCSVDRRTLMKAVWADETNVTSNALEVLVNALRAKVDAPPWIKTLRTVRGIGYCLQTPSPERERPTDNVP